jgi:hypothetical protein
MKKLDGIVLKEMLISGSNNLYNHYPEVDALNVFPVPDGDTGMNMNLTLTSGSKEIENRNDKDIYQLSKAFSRGLLMGARGNSGVITSQIFRGFSKGMQDQAEVDAVGFAAAWQKGVEVAYRAVMQPVEGTILTVIRESSQKLSDEVAKKSDLSIEKCMEIMIKEANESLKRTPDLLPVLKEAGVLDSGGFGLIKIFDGMYSALKGNLIERSQATATKSDGNKIDVTEGYDMTFVLTLGPAGGKKPYDVNKFASSLNNRAINVSIEQKGEKLEIKAHSNTPGSVLNFAQGFGEFDSISINNVAPSQEENKETPVEEARPEVREKYALITVSAGEGISSFFKEISPVQLQIVFGGQTMNPSAEDFIAAIRKCNADNIIILPNNSNIVLAANQACKMVEKEARCLVIPTKTIPQGLTASIMFNPDASLEENDKEMNSALAGVKSGSVTYAVRDTLIDGVEVKKDQFIGIADKTLICSKANKIEALLSLLDHMVDDESSIITLLLGADIAENQIEDLKAQINEKFPDLDLDIRMGGQPVYSFLLGVE